MITLMAKKQRPADAPDWAQARVKFMLATCWMGNVDCPLVEGVNWRDRMMLAVCELLWIAVDWLSWFVVRVMFGHEYEPVPMAYHVLDVYEGWEGE